MDSTVYKKRPFRFPFDINPKIFLGLSVFFFIFSFKPILNLFVQKDSQEVVDLIQKDIFNQTNSIKSFATNKAKIKRILDSKTTNEDLKKLTSYPFYFFIIKNNKIHFWNNSIVNPLIDSIKNEPFCIKTLNGIYYVQNWKIDSQVYIQFFIPIKQEYDFYKNYTSLGNKLFSNTKINTEQFEFSIQKIENAKILKVKNKPILYIKNKSSASVKFFNYSFWDLFFNLFFFIAFGVAIHTYFKVSIQYESKAKIFFYQIITIFSIRIFTYLFHLPNDFSEFHIFDPTLFHLDFLNCSLGDLFINVCLFFWILEFYSINVQSSRKFTNNKFISILVFVLLIGIIILINNYSVEIFKQVIISNINLEGTIQDIFYFPKFIALSSLLILVISNIFLILICNRYFEKINQTGKLKFILLIIFSIIYYFIVHPDNIFIHIVTKSWILIVLFLFHSQSKTIKFDFSSFRLLLWIAFISISTSSIINYFVYKNNYNHIQNISQDVTYKRNFKTEKKLHDIHVNIQKDSQIVNLFLSKDENSRQELYDLIINKYLSSKFNQKEYMLNLYGYIPESIVLFNKLNFDILDSNFHNPNSIAIDTQGKFLISNNTSLIYISKIEIKKEDKIIGHIFIRILKTQENNSPKIELFNPIYKKYTAASKYTSYAIYENIQLVFNSGSTEFPSKITDNYLANFKKSYRNYIFKKENIIFIVQNNMELLTMSISLFTVIFIVFLGVITLYIAGNIIARSNLNYYRILKLLNVNLRFRINFTFLIIELFSFAAIWFFISNYYFTISKENERAEIINSSTIIYKSLLNGFNEFNRINNLNNLEEINKIGNFKQLLKRISRLYNCEISIFNNSGELLYNTEPFINTTGLQNNFASPNYLFSEISKLNLNTVDEKIGNISYIAAYTPIYNQKNKLIGYLKSYYLRNSDKIKNQTSTVLIYISNIFILVFALSTIIAYFITSFLTKSFSKVVKQFTKINLNKTNEPLSWKYNDEIGILVMEYNRMLKKLEFNSLLLAKNNRELAWREMAKQVAHEIKNPLTPMKLSLQMLERAMKNNSPNFKELSENKLYNLIEQINNLENIAVNFSQFAKMPEMNATDVSLQEILKISTGIYHSNEDLEFYFILPINDYIIFADKEKIIRVITNLIQNAIQSIPNNKKGEISLITSKIKNNMIRISIEDNGCGISSEISQKIFEPNFTTKSSGAGLGLAMCKDIIEQIDGAIHFSTIIDKGTIFNIDLPIKEQLDEDETAL